jgi:hypothetical protein
MKKFLFALMLPAFAVMFASAQEQKPQMSFFVTSVGSGDGANLSGLAGADAQCQKPPISAAWQVRTPTARSSPRLRARGIAPGEPT